MLCLSGCAELIIADLAIGAASAISKSVKQSAEIPSYSPPSAAIESKICPQDLKTCSREVICVGARTKPYKNPNKAAYWSQLSIFKSYATEAKRRGLGCSGY